jgi:uncharacterized SAM-binding protein YcdF (DUF218 family)
MIRTWEVADNLPEKPPTAVVGMALSPEKDGLLGQLVLRVVDGVCTLSQGAPIIFSNRFPVGELSIAEAERNVAKALYGVEGSRIIIPENPHDPKIRNTFEEAIFAVSTLSQLDEDEKSLLIVANHIHMRRVLMTFRKVAPPEIKLYWHSVGERTDYGQDPVQKRFIHPLFFLGYEVLGIVYSKLKGWI